MTKKAKTKPQGTMTKKKYRNQDTI